MRIKPTEERRGTQRLGQEKQSFRCKLDKISMNMQPPGTAQ